MSCIDFARVFVVFSNRGMASWVLVKFVSDFFDYSKKNLNFDNHLYQVAVAYAGLCVCHMIVVCASPSSSHVTVPTLPKNLHTMPTRNHDLTASF